MVIAMTSVAIVIVPILVLIVGDQLSLPPCEHIDRWVALSSVERSFYDRLHKQVLSTQANHQASQKHRPRTTGPTRSVLPAALACCCCA